MKKTFLVFIIALLVSCNNHRSAQFNTEQVQDSTILLISLQDGKKEQNVINAIKESKQTEFANFELYDSLSVNIDNEGGKVYLLLIKPDSYSGIIVLACKYKEGVVTLLDENKNIIPFDTGVYFLFSIGEDNPTFYLRSEYGVDGQSGNETYFSYNSNNPEGVFVDSLLLSRKVYIDEEVYLEYATITQENFGKIRLKDLTNNIWDNYEIEFKKRE